MAEATKDWLAIMLIGAGSSYGRADNAFDAIANCKRSIEQDWGSLYDIDGQIGTINVADVTGFDSVYWDARGVFGRREGDEGKADEVIPVAYTVTAKLKGKKPAKKRR